jgi:hypothetical protein
MNSGWFILGGNHFHLLPRPVFRQDNKHETGQ